MAVWPKNIRNFFEKKNRLLKNQKELPFILDVVLKLGAKLLEQLVPTIYKGIAGEPHFLATVTLRFSFHNKLADKTTFRVQLVQLCIESMKKFCVL